MAFIESFQVSYQGFVSLPPIWVFRFLEVVLWCVLINTEGFPLPSPSLQFPLCAWNSNSITSLCPCCIYSYTPLKDELIYLFIYLFRLGGDEIHAGEAFLTSLQAPLGGEQPLQRGIFFCHFYCFPAADASWYSNLQLASMPLQVRL